MTKGYTFLNSTLHITGMSIVYDADLQFDNTESTGTILFTFPKITYELSVYEDSNTKELTTELKPQSFQCKDFTYRAYPFDKNMQMAIRGVILKLNLKGI